MSPGCQAEIISGVQQLRPPSGRCGKLPIELLASVGDQPLIGHLRLCQVPRQASASGSRIKGHLLTTLLVLCCLVKAPGRAGDMSGEVLYFNIFALARESPPS
jgi:hypothetical protein